MADIGASSWNETDANNSTASPEGWPTGMAPSGVDNTGRQMMGAVKRWYNWTVPKATGGSSAAFTLTYTVAPGALIDGMTHLVWFGSANAVGATLNVNGLGAIPLHYYSFGAWRAVSANLIGNNQIARVAYHGGSGAYRILDIPDRTGELVPFAGTTAPAGSLLCYGQAIDRTQYAGLFAALGTTYGTGDGSTTFNLPDLRSRVAAGKSNMGGVDNGTLTGGTVLGATLGFQLQNSLANIPGGTSVRNDVANVAVAPDGHIHQVSVVQPTIILNYVIRI